MPNLATAIKEEIRRLAKKEIKAQSGPAQKAVMRYRKDIAALKRQIAAQNKKIALLEKRKSVPAESTNGHAESSESIRFSAKSVKSQRARLGLSAMDYAKLVGVSHLTIYKWEKGETRPQRKQLEALAAVRGIGKREAVKRLGGEE